MSDPWSRRCPVVPDNGDLDQPGHNCSAAITGIAASIKASRQRTRTLTQIPLPGSKYMACSYATYHGVSTTRSTAKSVPSPHPRADSTEPPQGSTSHQYTVETTKPLKFFRQERGLPDRRVAGRAARAPHRFQRSGQSTVIVSVSASSAPGSLSVTTSYCTTPSSTNQGWSG